MDPKFDDVVAAALAGDLDRFVELLDGGADLVMARSGCSHPTLLQFVVLDGGTGRIPRPERFVRALVERGAELRGPVVAAASIGSQAMTALLLDAGAPVEAGDPWTPLEESVYWAHGTLAAWLRSTRGARVPSLRAAAGLGDVAALERFLVDDRAGPDAGPVRFPWGTPSADPRHVLDQALVIAAKNGQCDTGRRLLACGADPNAFPPGVHEGGSALHLACIGGRREMVDVLLAAGADPSLPDPRHHSIPAGWARHGGHDDLAAFLEGLA